MRKPLIVMREAAFFLQIRKAQAHYLYETGRLPAARLEDGGEWMPFDKRLIRAADFFMLLDESTREVFVDWQLGVVDIPKFDTNSLPPAISAVEPRAGGSRG